MSRLALPSANSEAGLLDHAPDAATLRILVGASAGIILSLVAVGAWVIRADSVATRAPLDPAYPSHAISTGNAIDVELTAAESEVDIVPGRSTQVWAFNGTVPGPALRVRLGDTLRQVVRDASAQSPWAPGTQSAP